MSEFDPKRLGGSDAGAICLGKPRTPGDVFLRIVDGVENPDNFYMAAGRAMEPVIRAEVEAELGISIEKPESKLIEDWGRASPDGIVVGCDEVWECKLAWSLDGYGTVGTDEIPPEHLLQVQWYMHVFGFPRCRLTVRPIWGSRNQSYMINRSERLGLMIETRFVRFFRAHILPKVPPPIQDVALLDKAYVGSFPNAKSRPCVLADTSVGRAMEALKLVRQREAQIAAMKLDLELTVKNAIGGFAGIEHLGERVQWLRPKPKKYVNWERVAMQQRLLLSTLFGLDNKADIDRIEREATVEKEQARRLYVPRTWTTIPGAKQLGEGEPEE